MSELDELTKDLSLLSINETEIIRIQRWVRGFSKLGITGNHQFFIFMTSGSIYFT